MQRIQTWSALDRGTFLRRLARPDLGPHHAGSAVGRTALVANGDTVTMDAENRRCDVDLSDAQSVERRARWTPPPPKARRGTLYKYIRTVKSASKGCVTDQ